MEAILVRSICEELTRFGEMSARDPWESGAAQPSACRSGGAAQLEVPKGVQHPLDSRDVDHRVGLLTTMNGS